MYTHTCYSGTYKHWSIYMCLYVHTYHCTCTHAYHSGAHVYTDIPPFYTYLYTHIYTMAVHMCIQMQGRVVYVHNAYICTHICITATQTCIHTCDPHRHKCTLTCICIPSYTYTDVHTQLYFMHAHILYPFTQICFRTYTCAQMYTCMC